MIAVIFEVIPNPEQKPHYLATAKALGARLADIDGFVSIERFQSLADPDKILSLSFWRDEQAVAAWREQFAHRQAQTQGRAAIFKDYRLRVCALIRDYGLFDREQAPPDSRACHDDTSKDLPQTGVRPPPPQNRGQTTLVPAT